VQGRRRVVEIGIWHGVTTRRLRDGMHPEGVLTAVDPFPAGRLGISLQERIARVEVDRARRGEVVWVRATGADAARAHGPIDFIFIDGDHSEEGLLEDWRAWSGLVERGGIVALHDSRSTDSRAIDDAGSVRVTNDVIRPDVRFTVLDEVDSLTVLERRAH
jgi:predicted O-methyltransferase YrrM